MIKAYLLRFHRWVALAFALPLLIVVGTGLILSFEPIVDAASVQSGSVTPAKLESLISKFDPQGKARGFSIDARLDVLTIQGVGDDGSTDIGLSSGEEADVDSALSDLFSTSRRLHQRLITGFRWLVTASAFAMLALAMLGLFMGFSRLRNNFSGWHKGVAWFLFPLVVISPLTGLFLAFNVNFGAEGGGGAGRAGGARAPRMTLADATHIAVQKVDPSAILSLGVRGGGMLLRVVEKGEIVGYALTKDGVAPTSRNWSRILHVGAGLWTGVLNVIASLAILVLLITGLTIWGKREMRMRAIKRAKRATADGIRAPA